MSYFLVNGFGLSFLKMTENQNDAEKFAIVDQNRELQEKNHSKEIKIHEKTFRDKKSDSKSKNPIEEALERVHGDVVKLLQMEGGNTIDDTRILPYLEGRAQRGDASRITDLRVLKYLHEEYALARDENGKEHQILLNLYTHAITEAAEKGNLDVVKYLYEECHLDVETDEGDGTLMKLAAESGNLDIVKYLWKIGHANVEAYQMSTEYNPLMSAAAMGHLEVVRYLIEQCGANIEAQDRFRETPLCFAAHGGHLDVVKYLVERKANVNHKSSYNNSALLHACKEGHLDVVKYLVERCGCDIEEANGADFNALHHAIAGGHLDIVKYLIERRGAKPSCRLPNGQTALHTAATYGQFEIAKYLVERCGCDRGARTVNKSIPAQFAAWAHFQALAEYLSEGIYWE